MLNDEMYKIDSMREQMNNVSKEMKILQGGKKKY
jgi:hypothetical protein